MHQSIIAFLTALILAPSLIFAYNPRQDITEKPERAAGHYFAYPEDEISTEYGAVPKGYKAFYLSHYGRHGSRYLTTDEGYTGIMGVLDKAAANNALTPQGSYLRAQLDTVYAEARGRAGELSPLGRRQHCGIARRMAAAYPGIIADSAEITAASTIVMRCAHSMFAFIEALKEINPSLDIPRESSMRHMEYLNYSSPESTELRSARGPYRKPWKKFRKEKAYSKRLMSSIFSDSKYAADSVDALKFAEDLYYLASDMQSVECGVNLAQWLTPEEIYDIWQLYNFKFFARYSSYEPANGAFIANARPIVKDIIDNADRYIASGKHGATLRFGHDINLMPLTALLGIDGCKTNETDPAKLADSFANYRVVPMAANLQMIFFRPTDGDGEILVRLFLNERDASLPLPSVEGKYYRWNELRPYLQSLIEK